MKLYIVRHGQTEWNVAGRLQGWKNSNLTDKGAANAKKLGESLKDIDFDTIYCSPAGRALDTAKHIIGDKPTRIVIKEELKEMGFGSWEGMEHAKLEELYPEQQFNLWNKPHLYEPVDGESYDQLIKRIKGLLSDIAADAPGENILLVSHAATIKAIYAIVKNLSLEDFWSPPYMKDTCLTILEVKDGELKFALEADTSHLKK